VDTSYSYTLHDRSLNPQEELVIIHPYRIRVFYLSKEFATDIFYSKRGARRWAKKQVRQHKAGKHSSQRGDPIESGILD
jgi:hypothetical protein